MTSKAIGSLFVSLGLDTAAFTAGVQQAQGSMGKFAARMRTAGTAMTAGITAPLAGLAVAAQAAARSLGSLDNQARVAGLAAQEFKIVALAARQFGLEQDKVGDILKDVNDKVGDFLQTGAGPMADFFENIGPKVGITADQFRDLNSADALALYVSSLEKANLSQSEMTFYMGAIASDATLLLPVFADNAKALNVMTVEAERLGLKLDGDLIASAKATEAQFQITKDVLGIQFQQALVQLAPAVSQIMGAVIPMVTQLAGWVTSLAEAFSALSPETQTFIAGAVGLAAAIGPVMVGIGFMIPAISALGAGLALLISPIGLVVAGVAALAAGAYAVYQNWDGIVAYFSGLWESLKTGFVQLQRDVAQAMIDLFVSVKGSMRQLASDMREWAGNIIDGFVQGFKAKIAGARDTVKGFASDVGGWFKSTLGIRSPSRVFAEYGDNVVQGLVVGIDRSAGSAIDAITDLGNRMKSAGQAAVDGMVATFADGLAKGDMAGAVKGAFSGFMDNAKTAFGDVLKNAFSGGGLKSITDTFKNAFKGIGAAFSGGGGFLAGIGGALSSALPIIGAVTSIVSLIKGFSSKTLVGSGLDLSVAGGKVGGTTSETINKKTFWGLFSKNIVNKKAISAELAKELNATLNAVQDNVQALYKGVGITVSEGVADAFKFTMPKIDTKGKTAEQIQQEVAAAFEGYQEALSKSITGLGTAAVQSFAGVNAALNITGQTLGKLSSVASQFSRNGVLASAAAGLEELFGGVQNMASALNGFVSTFFTDAEKVDLAKANVAAVFADLGLKIPKTMEQFKDLVLGQNLMTEAGRNAYAALIGIGDAFAFVSNASSDAAAASEDAAAASDAAAAAMAQVAEHTKSAFAALDGWYATEFDARLARAGQANGLSVTASVSRMGVVDSVSLGKSKDGTASLTTIYSEQGVKLLGKIFQVLDETRLGQNRGLI